MLAQSRSFESRSEDQTSRLAQRLGAMLKPGDTVLLEGDIGAGKTHIARQLIQSLQDRPEDVPSPTFTLIQTYDTRAGEIWHADLYRLTEPGEIEELGLTEAFDTAICLIEWPDRMGSMTPKDALVLTLKADPIQESTRHLTFSWTSPRWAKIIQALTA